MALLFVNDWSATNGSTVTTIFVDVNSEATIGSLLVAGLTVRGGGDALVSTPTGWNLREFLSSGGSRCIALYDRIATGDVNDSPTLNWTDSGRPVAVVTEYTGAHATAPFESSDSGDQTSGTSPTTPTISPLTANGTAIAIIGVRNGNEWGDDSADDLLTSSPFRCKLNLSKSMLL